MCTQRSAPIRSSAVHVRAFTLTKRRRFASVPTRLGGRFRNGRARARKAWLPPFLDRAIRTMLGGWITWRLSVVPSGSFSAEQPSKFSPSPHLPSISVLEGRDCRRPLAQSWRKKRRPGGLGASNTPPGAPCAHSAGPQPLPAVAGPCGVVAVKLSGGGGGGSRATPAWAASRRCPGPPRPWRRRGRSLPNARRARRQGCPRRRSSAPR